MRILRMLLLTVFAALVLSAQDKPAPQKEETEATVIQVKNLTGDSFKRLVNILNVFNTRFTSDDRMRIIVVYAPKPVVEQMRKVIAELDKPGTEASVGRNIEMEMTLLRCAANPPATAAPLPPGMEAVAKQLRAASLCKNVQVWDSIPMHLQEGKQATSDSSLPTDLGPDLKANAMQQTVIQVESIVTRPSGRYIRFEKFVINMRFPVRVQDGNRASVSYNSTGMTTSGEFKEGQKTVLGKLSGSDQEGSIFVVISLKINE